MPKNLLTLLLAFISITAVTAQEKKTYEGKGTLRFESEDYDFGIVKEEAGDVIATFTFKNVGRHPVVIKDIKTSCGCTASDWSRDTIQPGSSGYVKAIYTPRGQNGPFEKALFVYTDGVPFQHFLTIRGQVTPRPLTIEDSFPSKFGTLMMTNTYIDMGFVYHDEKASVDHYIYNAGEKDVTVNGITGRPAFIEVNLENLVLKAKTKTRIRFTFDAKAAKDYGESIYMLTMIVDDPAVQEMDLHVHSDIIERFPKMSSRQMKKAPVVSVDPEMQEFAKLMKGDTAIMYYKVTNLGKKPLAIRKVNTTCGCVAITMDKKELKKGESTTIQVMFMTAGREGPQEKSVTIITNDPAKPIKKVFFKGEIVTNPNAL